MVALDTDLKQFERVLANVADTTGASSFAKGQEGRNFVKFQARKLVETLVNVTPPKKKAGLEKKLAKKVSKSFVAVAGTSTTGTENEWLFATSNFLYGVPRDYDQRGVTVQEASRLLYSNQIKPTEERAFRTYKPRTQRIKIFRKWLTDRRTTKGLVQKLKSHVGRLKAGWLPTWDALGVTKQVAQWIGRHRQGARGDFLDGLATTDKPFVVMVNRAVGTGTAINQVKIALRIRSKAMAADMRLIIAGKKQKGWL